MIGVPFQLECRLNRIGDMKMTGNVWPFASFRRRPESSGFTSLLDSGLRRNDGVPALWVSSGPDSINYTIDYSASLR